MLLALNGEKEEKKYHPFVGCPIDVIPSLREQGYELVSTATTIDRRINAPEEVRDVWRVNGFWTGDCISIDREGNVVLTLDAVLTLDLKILRSINSKRAFYFEGGSELIYDKVNELKKSDNSITLSYKEFKKALGRGLMNYGGLWKPVNPSVAKILGHYLRGRPFEDRGFQEYAQYVSVTSKGPCFSFGYSFYSPGPAGRYLYHPPERKIQYSTEIMKCSFGEMEWDYPKLYPLFIFGTDNNSNILNHNGIFCNHTIGVIPNEDLKRKK